MVEFDSFFIGCIFLFLSFTALLFFKNKLDRLLKLKKLARVLSWNTMLTIYGVLVVFMIGESYYRFFIDTTDSFAINKISERWNSRHVSLNNYHLRDNLTYQLGIAKNKRRLTIIGDSFSRGHGIKDVGNRFANIIRDRNPDLEVHVIAKNGFSSYSQLLFLEELINTRYEFDVVLLAYCLNDIDYFIRETNDIYSRIHAFKNELTFLEKESYFLNTLSFRYFAINDPDYMQYSDFVLNGYHGESWEMQQETLLQMTELVRKRKGKFVVMTFPFLQQTAKEYTFKTVHNSLDNLWKSKGVPNLDLTTIYEPYLGERLTINEYDAHPNEFAHQLAADAIEKYFLSK